MNKYEVLGVVGEGAYGVVLKCKNKENSEITAIKKFKETEDNENVKKSIQREVKVLRMLKHPNIVELKEAFKRLLYLLAYFITIRKGRIYLVFEFVEKNLLEVLETSANGLDPQTIRKVIFQLLRAIDFCHQNDIVHRDIKPENLLIGLDGNLKLCDFGFARSLISSNQEPLTDYVATRWYRAPELLLSYQTYGKGVDLWAVGCLICELTDGNPLFPGENEVDQLYLIQKLLGPLTSEQQEVFSKNPRFVGMKFPELSKPETIERRFLGKLPKKAIGFVKGLLKMEPKERFTCREAMKHPYFEELPEAQEYWKEIDSQNFKERRESAESNPRVHLNTIQSMPTGGVGINPSSTNNITQSQNMIRQKNLNQKVPNFLNNQMFMMQNTAYNYKIDQNDIQYNSGNKMAEDSQSLLIKKALVSQIKNNYKSIDKLPQTFYNGFGKMKLSDQQDQQKLIQQQNGFPSIKYQQQPDFIHVKSNLYDQIEVAKYHWLLRNSKVNQQIANCNMRYNNKFKKQQNGNQASVGQIKIQNLNIIYNQNTYMYPNNQGIQPGVNQKQRKIIKKK